MFLSVSMPVYNSSKYIDKCIESVIEQSFKDFELILVDDGSTDDSVEKCEQWVRKYPDRIRLVKKENSGSLFTRRRCLFESIGDYIYIMDSDDYLIRKDALQIVHDTILRTKCDLVFFNCTSKENSDEGMFKFPFQKGDVFEGQRLSLIYKYYIQSSGLKPLWNKVFHRSLVDWDANYSSYTDITNGTDYFQSTPIINSAKRICYLNEVLYFYRRNDNPSSIVHKFKPTIYYSARSNFIRMCEASSSWQIDNAEKEKMLSAACMKMVSTSAYKIRLINRTGMKPIEYLRSIGEDDLFRKFYNRKAKIGIKRLAIVFALYHRYYMLLYIAINCLRN